MEGWRGGRGRERKGRERRKSRERGIKEGGKESRGDSIIVKKYSFDVFHHNFRKNS